MSDSLFTQADLVFTYTAEQAVADGVLMDARQGEIAEVTAQHVKAELPVYIAHGLRELIQRAVDNRRTGNDWKGVWHDILSIWRLAVRLQNNSDFMAFEVLITGAGRKKKHRIFAVLDGAGLTFMLPSDY